MIRVLGEDTNRQQSFVVQAGCPPWDIHGGGVVFPGPFRHHGCHHERQILHRRRYRTSYHGNTWELWSRKGICRVTFERNPIRCRFEPVNSTA